MEKKKKQRGKLPSACLGQQLNRETLHEENGELSSSDDPAFPAASLQHHDVTTAQQLNNNNRYIHILPFLFLLYHQFCNKWFQAEYKACI